MNIKHTVSAKVLFGCLNFIFFVVGFMEVVCGFLLLCDSKRILLSRLLASPEGELIEPPFYYLALALLTLGLIVCAVASLGVWATYMPGYVVLTIYFISVLSLLVCECAGGVVAAVWPRCLALGLRSARGGAVGALQAYYAVPEYEDFTAAVDLAQTELECCGMTSARNYDMSVWQLRRLGPRGVAVPLTCCVQRDASYLSPLPVDQARCQEIKLDPDSRHAASYPAGMLRNDVRVTTTCRCCVAVPCTCCVQRDASYLSPLPVDQARCQEIKLDPDSRHAAGCLSKLDDWYQQQYMIFMLALFVVAVFKLAILFSTVFSCIRIKRRRQNIHGLMIKSTDMKPNENIYEHRISGNYDEPITARYIQPNNFYSPRVRNPTIFQGKPNDVI